MIAHVIHDPKRVDRFRLLIKELQEQNLEYALFPAIKHVRPCTGISRAHKQIVQYAKDNGLPEVLILEDDVRFCGVGSFDYFISNKPAEFDIYLAGIYSGKIEPDNTVKNFSGLHCYIVHSGCYDRFLKLDENRHIDRATIIIPKKYVCNPFAACQYDTFSDNVKKQVSYTALLSKREFYNNFRP